MGLSGGVDSVVLLHVLAGLRTDSDLDLAFDLGALHVHHGLSPNADCWADFCAGLCRDWGVPLEIVRLRVSRTSGLGLEAAAREGRYLAYARADTRWIVLAHHRDDQAETLLLNLLRGAGVHGASAMPEARPLASSDPSLTSSSELLRPLLAVSRADIETYARRHGLSWIEDESNADMALTRNFLRAEVLPTLRHRFPHAHDSLSRATEHFSEAAGLLSELADLDLAGLQPDGGLPVALLARLSAARGRNLLRHWLQKNGVLAPDARHLGEMRRQLLEAGSDAGVAIKLGRSGQGLYLRRHRGAAYLVPQRSVPVERPWRGEREVPWAGGRLLFDPAHGAGIRAERLGKAPVLIRPRQGGEQFRPDAHRPGRSLKKLLQEAAVPPWRRDVLPCLWCGEDLVWVAGLGVALDWQCEPEEPGWVPGWTG